MELAGLKVVMDADFTQVYASLAQANSMLQNFGTNVRNAFNAIPDFKGKFNFTTNGASQAAQDAREYARAAREQAAADLDAAKAKDIADRAQERQNRTNASAKDEWGQLVAANQALVREYYNAAASIARYGDAAGITATELEALRVKAKAGQDQLASIEAGAGRFQRNVGNYASGFSPLQNSINQITREMPAFANSLQTGFMAISNNLAPLADALKQLSVQQKQAAEEAIRAAEAKAAQAEASAVASGATAKEAAEESAHAKIMALATQAQLELAEATRLNAEATAIAAGAAQAEAKAEAKLAASLAISNAEQVEAAAAARIKAEAEALAAGASDAEASAAGRLAAAQSLANSQTANTPGILGKLTASIFSWQTALSVGITLLTVYGPKLAGLITGSSKHAEALKEEKRIQEELNNIQKQSYDAAGEQISKLITLQSTMTNANVPLKKRAEAYKEAVKEYPSYLSKLKEDDALNGALAKTINNEVIPAILAAARARANQKKIDLLAAQSAKISDELDAERSRLNSVDKSKSLTGIYEKYKKQSNTSNKALQQINAQSEKNVTDEDLLQQSIVKGLSNSVDEKVAAQKDIEAKIQELVNKNTGLGFAQGNINASSLTESASEKDKAAKSAKDATTALEDLAIKNKEVDAELSNGSTNIIDALTQKISNYKSFIADVTKESKYQISPDDSRVVDARKNIETLTKALADMKNQDDVLSVLKNTSDSLTDISESNIDGVITDVDALQQRLNITVQAVKQLRKLNETGNATTLIEQYSTQAIELKAALTDAKLLEGARKLSESLKLISDQKDLGIITNAEALSQKIGKIKQAMLDLAAANQQGTDSFKNLQGQMKQLSKDESLAKFMDEVRNAIKDTISKTAESIGEGIGNLIAGTGGITNIFKGIGNVLADQVKAFGELLVKYGVEILAAQAAIKALAIAPGLAIVAGVALIALSQFAKSELNKSSQSVGSTAFAAGGVVYGPTNALVGEYAGARGNPEVIAPLDKLKSILSDQGIGQRGVQVFIPEVRIKGQDLVLAFERTKKSNG